MTGASSELGYVARNGGGRYGGRLGAGANELFGDIGLALQPGQPQRPIHALHWLPTLQPPAHHGDYLVRTGCTWRQLPFDFPPWQTVSCGCTRWQNDKITEQILAVRGRRARAAQGRAEVPTAGSIDAQSVKGADSLPPTTRGYDAGKKVNGRKRFIITDTLGLLLVACVMAASVQDRDGAKTTLESA